MLTEGKECQNLRTKQVEIDQREKQVISLSHVQGCAENVEVATSSTVWWCPAALACMSSMAQRLPRFKWERPAGEWGTVYTSCELYLQQRLIAY